MFLNGVRIFLTGFAVFYIDPQLGEGVMHYTEGWFMFVAAMIVLAGAAWAVHWAEHRGSRFTVGLGGESRVAAA
jgi:exosortase/archaeosortase family protein